MSQEQEAITQLHDAMAGVFKAAMPSVVRLEAFPDLEDGFDVPAIFFGLSEFEPGPDSGTGLTAIHGKFQALILVDASQPHAAAQGLWLSTRMASVLRAQYWGLDFVHETKDVKAVLDDSNPDLHAFVTWAVSWTQVFHVGDDTDFPWPDLQPSPVGMFDPDAVVVELEVP